MLFFSSRCRIFESFVIFIALVSCPISAFIDWTRRLLLWRSDSAQSRILFKKREPSANHLELGKRKSREFRKLFLFSLGHSKFVVDRREVCDGRPRLFCPVHIRNNQDAKCNQPSHGLGPPSLFLRFFLGNKKKNSFLEEEETCQMNWSPGLWRSESLPVGVKSYLMLKKSYYVAISRCFHLGGRGLTILSTPSGEEGGSS